MMGNNDGNNDARQYYADVERENASLRRVVVTLEDEVAQLRAMASTLWHNSECLRWPGKCSDGPYELCEVCKAGQVVESWEEQ